MARGVVPISPRQIDPLSWITGSLVPLIFAAITAAYGARAIALDAGRTDVPLQLSAAILFITAQLILFAVSRGLQRTIGLRAAVVAVGVGVIAMLVSALGYSGRSFPVAQWWAPMSLALVFGALGPYLPASRILVVCGIATALVVPPSVALVAGSASEWGPVSLVVIVAVAPLAGGLLAAVLSLHVVRRMRALLEARSRTVIVPGRPLDDAAERAERIRLAALTARAVPFLESVVAAGAISDADRALAGQLARRLRDDLVTQSSASWLDRWEGESRLVVVDPDGRADALRPSQRTALRALIRTLLAEPNLHAQSLLIELRAVDDGATAVGITMDVDHPEGRRMMFLAPAMLTLETAADGVDLIAGEALRLTFRFPREQSSQPPSAARRRRPRFRR